MGKAWPEIEAKLKQDVPTTIQSNWAVWAPVQLINLYFTPLQYRVIVIQFVFFFWSIYLSYKANLAVQG